LPCSHIVCLLPRCLFHNLPILSPLTLLPFSPYIPPFSPPFSLSLCVFWLCFCLHLSLSVSHMYTIFSGLTVSQLPQPSTSSWTTFIAGATPADVRRKMRWRILTYLCIGETEAWNHNLNLVLGCSATGTSRRLIRTKMIRLEKMRQDVMMLKMMRLEKMW
jgi:hypothetical protein